MYFLFLIWLFDEQNIDYCGFSVFYKVLKHKRGASGTKPFKKYNSLSWNGKISDISVKHYFSDTLSGTCPLSGCLRGSASLRDAFALSQLRSSAGPVDRPTCLKDAET